MRTSFIAFAALACLCVDVAYADDVLLDNTVVTTSAGQSTRWLFSADGAYRAIGPDGAEGRGTWRRQNGQLCVTPTSGPEACMPWPEGKAVGDRWASTNNSGGAFDVEIRAGRD